ncbi:vitelline membrane outer layer protein 1-like [Paroedura picta]|uniref:vitelline membrane outer layer protein 1-like n=1 Tax=Paroedura picta TaxID=143630 RepID=UPI004056B2E7
MHLFITSVLSLLFSCCLWELETRIVISTLSVSNGGKWGDWGKKDFCLEGFIEGFALKLPKDQGTRDKVGAIGIRGFCSDSTIVNSSVGTHDGLWTQELSCWYDNLKAFSLRVTEPQGITGDDTAVNNIKFKCSGGMELEGEGPAWGKYGEWSGTCITGEICGIQTKVEKAKFLTDRTELNDVKFFCCK